ncbi:MAG: ribonuclease [Clostridia bacterium]|nr:ribonuclease [Clostridia bacterium]
MKQRTKLLCLWLGLVLALSALGCVFSVPTPQIDLWTAEPQQMTPAPLATVPVSDPSTASPTQAPTAAPVSEDGVYDGKDDVALYLHLYGHLPSNYITKAEAESLGWSGGSLERYAPGKCIGGDRFGNYEKLLPIASGRTYWECDIDTLGAKSRGAKRIVYSGDGLIFYTDDHYESFTQLYGGN